jgi:hypothetical protein
MGPATASATGLESAREITAATAITGAIHIDRQEATRSARRLRSGSPDGLHSRSRLCVISIRQTVRTTASRLKNAS